MRPSIQAIAEKVGVSTATVSRALNDREGVNAETRQRILQIAQEMGYVPNAAARGLAMSRTYTLGLITYKREPQRPISNFPDEMIQGIDQEARQRGYHVITTFVDNEMMQSIANVPLINDGRVDGVILVGPAITANFIIQLHNHHLPLVLVDNLLQKTAIDAIVCDNVDGTYGITRHLIREHSLRKLVFLSGPADWFSSRERRQGYEKALAEINQEPHVIFMEDTTMPMGYAAMQQAFELYPDLEGVVAVNDATAFGAIRACKEKGCRVPGDVAFTGFDNTGYAPLHDPPLTTVRMFKYETGIQAVRHLTDKIERKLPPGFQLRLGTELIVRASCGCSPGEEQIYAVDES